jgi:prolyl-tRNA synthetase
MRQSQLFTKTIKENPADEISKNAQLLTRAGFIFKQMAGVYNLLPLGLRVLNKINNIIREEMNKIGGQELFMTALQNKDLWEKTNRWSDDVVDNWFKTKLKNETELGLGFTHEEVITNILKNYIKSYKDLPVAAYQIQTKFRNELRAKSGIMRGREFFMKDMYSFSKNEDEHMEFYEKAKVAYKNVFERLGIGEKTFITFASGGSFSKYSHEFQTLSEAGEDTIFVDYDKKVAINKEVLNDEVLADLGLERENLKEEKAIEVGNIFNLANKFSNALELYYTDENGQKKEIIMGSYGIGPTRIMGTVVELFSDEKGIVWPKSISPFDIHLISIVKNKDEEEKVNKIYFDLLSKGFEVLYDDRDLRAGEKFADSDLIGISKRIIVSSKTLENDSLEIKNRNENESQIIKIKELEQYV